MSKFEVVRVSYTVAEVARMLGIPKQSCYLKLASGEIPSRRLGKRYFIPKTMFHAWVDGGNQVAKAG
jgi:excisionase family DNA binding protein